MGTEPTLNFWKKRRDTLASIEEKVENLIKKKIEDLGYQLYDVQYVKEGQSYFLRIFIEKENGSIDLNDCEKVKDKHLEDNIENEVQVNLFKPMELLGKKIKEVQGVLKSFNKDKIILQTENKNTLQEILIERRNISQIKTVFNWDNVE